MAAAHVELNAAGQFDDGLGMTAVLEQSVFDGLGTIDKQAAEQAVLFLGDPLAAAVASDEDDGGGTNTRWRFDELHVGIPFLWRSGSLPRGDGLVSEHCVPDCREGCCRRKAA